MNANDPQVIPGDWHPGTIPDNAVIETGAYLETSYSFRLHRSRLPDSVRVARGASVYQGTMFDLGPRGRVSVGRFALLNGAWIICDAEVSVGDHALVAWNVVIMDNYRAAADPASRRRQMRLAAGPHRWPAGDRPARPVRIGANAWIGFDCCILPGVTIGEGAVIGARSVVTEDVPPGAVFVGNPARSVRRVNRNGSLDHVAIEA